MNRRWACLRRHVVWLCGFAPATTPATALVAQGAPTFLLMGCALDPLGAPIGGARAWIEGRADTAESDPLGRFAIPGLPSGRHLLRLRKIGFRLALHPVQVHQNDGACRPFPMQAAEGIGELDTINVRGRRVDQANLRGFYARIDSKMYPVNSFLTAEQAENVSASQTSDWLRLMQGVRVLSTGRRGDAVQNQIRVRGGPGGTRDCVPFVYVDGLLFDRQGRVDDISPSAVAAIEVHGGLARTPPEFQGGNNQCGVVLVWTRTR
jgi:hypothetical protein